MERRQRGKSGNLAPPLTSFVGRRREVADIRKLLASSRLVTLTGPGGVGKTRLALRVAADMSRAFPDGVWLAELDALRDEAQIAQRVAAAVGVVEQAGRPLREVLAEYLAGRHLLLVLDNCEHVMDAAANLTDRLLRTAPDLRVLATSREPLGIPGEVTLAVPPLSVPNAGPLAPLSQMLSYEAVRLFVERAAAVVLGFQLTDQNQTAVAETCDLLEGLPLALELAAARLRVLTPEQIRDRLSDRLTLLTGGSRSAPARHQTLRACIDWSFDLCTRAEQRFWARLSVFTGGFDLDAAQTVCAGREVPAADVLELVSSLIDKSILTRDEHADTARYRMLDTLRDYGAERLIKLTGNDRVERRHRDYYAALASRGEAAWTGPDQLRWARTLLRDHANIQTAIEYSLKDPGGVAAGQELTARLWFFWICCGYLREGRYYLERALARGGNGRPRRLALWACAFVAASQGDLGVAETLLEQCWADARAHDDAQLQTYATETRAMILLLGDDLDAAMRLTRNCQAYYRSREQLDPGLLRILPIMGLTLVMRGDYDTALDLAATCQGLYKRLGEQWQRSSVHYFTGLALRGKANPTRAAHQLATAIETKHQFHDIIGVVTCLEPLAGTAADLGDGTRAARLLGAAEQLRNTFGLPTSRSPFHTHNLRTTEQRARELLTPTEYEQACHEGQAMTLDDVVAYTLTHIHPGRRRPSVPAPTTTPLTPRETEVAALVGEGLTNREIAARLVISTRTAESHLEHILTKLGFTSRTQLAAWTATRQHP